MKNHKKLLILTVLIAAGMLLGVVLLRLNDTEAPAVDQPTPRSFDECVAAGNPVMESFPEQCRSEDGQVFVNDITIDDRSLEEVEPAQ